MSNHQHGQEVLSLITRVHAGTSALAASLPPGALGVGPKTQAAQEAKLEEVRAQAEAAGDPRDAPLNIESVSKTGPEMGIDESR